MPDARQSASAASSLQLILRRCQWSMVDCRLLWGLLAEWPLTGAL